MTYNKNYNSKIVGNIRVSAAKGRGKKHQKENECSYIAPQLLHFHPKVDHRLDSNSHRKFPTPTYFSSPLSSSFSPIFIPNLPQSLATLTLFDHSPYSIIHFPLSINTFPLILLSHTTPLFTLSHIPFSHTLYHPLSLATLTFITLFSPILHPNFDTHRSSHSF